MRQPPDPEQDQHLSRQARLVAFVIAGTAVLWIGVQWLGGTLGWETRFVFLFDFAAIAAFIWAMVMTYQIWRKHQD